MTAMGQFPRSRAPLFTRLEVIDDERPSDAALNLATDEALLECLTDTPLLRIYRWEQAAVSFGYFDAVEPVRSAYPGRELVRRWTGGGIVEHGQDFAYSLLVPRTHGLTDLRAEESYRLLHGAVAVALSAAAPDVPALEEHQPTTAASGEASRACFVNAVRHDLLLEGRKIAGAAQRRTRRGWLHQGSVQMPGTTAVLYERLRQTLPWALAVDRQPRGLRPVEKEVARQLVRSKYGTAAWTERC